MHCQAQLSPEQNCLIVLIPMPLLLGALARLRALCPTPHSWGESSLSPPATLKRAQLPREGTSPPGSSVPVRKGTLRAPRHHPSPTQGVVGIHPPHRPPPTK